MLRLKKTALIVIVLGSSCAFSGTMGPVCTPGNVTVPCVRSAWDIGGQALYLQTVNNSHSDFARYVPGDAFNAYTGDWNWGFQVEASYHFNTGNDININWYHLDADDGFVNNISRTHLNQQWDAVNAEIGQFVDVSANKKIRFHGGFQFAHIKSSAIARPLVGGTLGDRFQYNGFGPRTGIDMNYVFGNGLGVYAKAATTLLTGTSKFYSAPGFVTPPPKIFSGSRTALVSEIEAKLGANYTYAMAQGDVSLDAGYMWFNYLHALENSPLYRVNNRSNFAAAGPYFGLKYVGAI